MLCSVYGSRSVYLVRGSMVCCCYCCPLQTGGGRASGRRRRRRSWSWRGLGMQSSPWHWAGPCDWGWASGSASTPARRTPPSRGCPASQEPASSCTRGRWWSPRTPSWGGERRRNRQQSKTLSKVYFMSSSNNSVGWPAIFEIVFKQKLQMSVFYHSKLTVGRTNKKFEDVFSDI